MTAKKKVEKAIELEIYDGKECFIESFQCPICEEDTSHRGDPYG